MWFNIAYASLSMPEWAIIHIVKWRNDPLEIFVIIVKETLLFKSHTKARPYTIFQWKVSSNWNVMGLTLKKFVFFLSVGIFRLLQQLQLIYRMHCSKTSFLFQFRNILWIDILFILSLPPTKASLIPFILVNIKKFWINLYWQYTLLEHLSLHINTVYFDTDYLWSNLLPYY